MLMSAVILQTDGQTYRPLLDCGNRRCPIHRLLFDLLSVCCAAFFEELCQRAESGLGERRVISLVELIGSRVIDKLCARQDGVQAKLPQTYQPAEDT